MKPSGNTWKLASRSFAAVAMAAALAACGGGDDDNDVAPPPGGTMTQADAETWSRTAASGFALVNVAQTLMQLDLRDYTSSQLPAGQQRTTSNCPSGGTITVDYRKTAGGAVGDYIQLDYDNCRNADTEQDGMRRLAVVAANRDAVRFEERFRDYSFRAQGAIDVEIDDGVLAVSVGDAGRPLEWFASNLKGDVEALNDQTRRAYAPGDVTVSGNAASTTVGNQTTMSFTLNTRHESGLELRAASNPNIVSTDAATNGAVLLTTANRPARVLNTLDGGRTVVQLDSGGSGQYGSSSVIDARLY